MKTTQNQRPVPTLRSSASGYLGAIGSMATVIVIYLLSIPNIVGVIVPEIDFTITVDDPKIQVVKTSILPLDFGKSEGDGERHVARSETPPPATIEVEVPTDPFSDPTIGGETDPNGAWDPNGSTDPGSDPGNGSRFDGSDTAIVQGGGGGGEGQEVFEWAEVSPEINMAELAAAIRYPDIARRNNIEGTVHLRVLVGKDGSIYDVEILSSDNELLDQAAIDGVRSVRFTPAEQNGTAVNCWVVVPVQFRLGR